MPGLEVVGSVARLPPVVPQDAEDRAHADADVEVRRAVERVEHDAVPASFFAVAQEDRGLSLLRGEDRNVGPVAEAPHDDLVGDDVQLLLGLAVRVDVAMIAEDVLDARPPDLVGDRLCREGDGGKNPGKVAGGVGIETLLGQNVRLERREVVGRVLRPDRVDPGIVTSGAVVPLPSVRRGP
jgi:hypothetical protein